MSRIIKSSARTTKNSAKLSHSQSGTQRLSTGEQKILKQFNKILKTENLKNENFKIENSKIKRNCTQNNFKIICLTGAMASGKNFVASILEKENFISIDLDKEAHKVLEQKTLTIFENFENLANEKNIKIRNSDNSLNRKNLGALLFSFPELLVQHEKIIYPALTKNIFDLIDFYKNQNKFSGIILNGAVLYKVQELINFSDFIIFVNANFFKRLFRAKKRDKLNFSQILKRFISQKNLIQKYSNLNIPLYKINN